MDGGTSGTTTSTAQQPTRERAGTPQANVALRLLLFGSFIVNTMKQDNMFILASVLNLTASLLLRKAAVLEAEEQQIAPGVTTFANNLKLIATAMSIGVSSLLLWALLLEISIRQRIVGVSAAPTTAGAAGALLVR
ncbi:MAG: hypothetical protein ACM3TR_10755 [Caulobacteraceae bacterium]